MATPLLGEQRWACSQALSQHGKPTQLVEKRVEPAVSTRHLGTVPVAGGQQLCQGVMWCRCLRQEMNYGHLFGIWVDKNRGQSLTPPMRLNNAQHINGVGTSKYATPKSHGSPYFFQSWEGESNTQSPISYCCLYIYMYIYIYVCIYINPTIFPVSIHIKR